MQHTSLLVARVLRLTGIGLVGVFFLATAWVQLLAYSYPSPEVSRLALVGILVALMGATLGIPLTLIGNAVSPPDPWLDFWLNPLKFRRSLKPHPENVPSKKTGIWAIVASYESGAWPLGLSGKCSVEFDNGRLFLEEPGKDLVMIEPKKVLRTSDVTLLLDTGRFANYGKVTLNFDSARDADTVERETRKLAQHS